MYQNQKSWNEEYKKSQLITKDAKPQKDFLRFLEWMKKNKHLDFSARISVLDLGCGIGRNAFYMAEHYGAQAYGWDFSESAIAQAKKRFTHEQLIFEKRDITKDFPLPDESIDLALDITVSNALSQKERREYLRELARIMKKGAFLYVRTLAKEGDKNAQNLIKKFPGEEKDTYHHPSLQVCERVFTGPDFKEAYGEFFDVIRMTRKTGYQRFGNQSYKRNYWNAYLQKK